MEVFFVKDTSDVNNIFNGRLSYDKGSYTLRMLRFTLGDSVFFKAMNQYLNDPLLKNKFATTADFKRNVEQVSSTRFNLLF
jgi:aminopeptidase N